MRLDDRFPDQRGREELGERHQEVAARDAGQVEQRVRDLSDKGLGIS